MTPFNTDDSMPFNADDLSENSQRERFEAMMKGLFGTTDGEDTDQEAEDAKEQIAITSHLIESLKSASENAKKPCKGEKNRIVEIEYELGDVQSAPMCDVCAASLGASYVRAVHSDEPGILELDLGNGDIVLIPTPLLKNSTLRFVDLDNDFDATCDSCA